MNINNPTTFGSPNLTLGLSNSSGTGGALRADDTILVYDATVPTTIASAASAATGSAATSARRDHTHGMYTVTAQAIQAALEAQTNQDTYAAPDMLKYSPGVAIAWCQIESSGGTLEAGSYNVGSVDDTGTGDMRINLTNATESADAFICTFGTDIAAGGTRIERADTDSVDLMIYNSSNALSDAGGNSHFAAFGTFP